MQKLDNKQQNCVCNFDFDAANVTVIILGGVRATTTLSK